MQFSKALLDGVRLGIDSSNLDLKLRTFAFNLSATALQFCGLSDKCLTVIIKLILYECLQLYKLYTCFKPMLKPTTANYLIRQAPANFLGKGKSSFFCSPGTTQKRLRS